MNTELPGSERGYHWCQCYHHLRHHDGAYAFIGAGAVVTKDVLPYALVIGNPADRLDEWKPGHKLEFSESGHAVCSGTGQQYVLKDGRVEDLLYEYFQTGNDALSGRFVLVCGLCPVQIREEGG